VQRGELERQSLESLTALSNTEATERGAPLSGISGPNPAGLAKFERMQEEGYLDLVYENERVKIYRVRG
jgi:hypothetical protein